MRALAPKAWHSLCGHRYVWIEAVPPAPRDLSRAAPASRYSAAASPISVLAWLEVSQFSRASVWTPWS